MVVSPNELITHYGTQADAARALGCAQSTVAEWVASGQIPEGRQYQAEIATKGRLKADTPALRVGRRQRLSTKEATNA